jgi:hypothetical protein
MNPVILLSTTALKTLRYVPFEGSFFIGVYLVVRRDPGYDVEDFGAVARTPV